MLRATNKETGTGLTDRHVVAQSNSFVIAGELYKISCFQIRHMAASATALSAIASIMTLCCRFLAS